MQSLWGGLARLPRSLVTGNVKAFLTLAVFLLQVLVTLSIMLFTSIHFLVWSACNSPFAAEQAVILPPAEQAHSGTERLSCPPETVGLRWTSRNLVHLSGQWAVTPKRFLRLQCALATGSQDIRNAACPGNAERAASTTWGHCRRCKAGRRASPWSHLECCL